jgi:hypothetical protein
VLGYSGRKNGVLGMPHEIKDELASPGRYWREVPTTNKNATAFSCPRPIILVLHVLKSILFMRCDPAV